MILHHITQVWAQIGRVTRAAIEDIRLEGSQQDSQEKKGMRRFDKLALAVLP